MKTYVASAVALTALIVGLGGARADALQNSGGLPYDRAGRVADNSADRAEGGRN